MRVLLAVSAAGALALGAWYATSMAPNLTAADAAPPSSTAPPNKAPQTPQNVPNRTPLVQVPFCNTPDCDKDGHLDPNSPYLQKYLDDLRSGTLRVPGSAPSAIVDDCDDHDANRYPGRPEVCDVSDHDEDCNPKTFGMRDSDGDGHFDSQCGNKDGAIRYSGNDCDDNAAWVYPGSQICTAKPDEVAWCGADGRFRMLTCTPMNDGRQTVCLHQPNDLGVCVPK